MKIILSGNLRRFANYEAELDIEATSVPDALARLIERYPDFRSVLYDQNGNLRALHRLHLNGEILSTEEVASREVGADDELGILTALAGG